MIGMHEHTTISHQDNAPLRGRRDNTPPPTMTSDRSFAGAINTRNIARDEIRNETRCNNQPDKGHERRGAKRGGGAGRGRWWRD